MLGSDQLARDTAQRVARESYGKLIAFLAKRTRDVAAAEDALSDAFAAALRDWPVNCVPISPEAWLVAVAKRKIVDAARNAQVGGSFARTPNAFAGGTFGGGAKWFS